MKKPYILAVDDDASVLRAVGRDLRARYSSDYRVLLTARADSQAAINAIQLNHHLRNPWELPERNLYLVRQDW